MSKFCSCVLHGSGQNRIGTGVCQSGAMVNLVVFALGTQLHGLRRA